MTRDFLQAKVTKTSAFNGASYDASALTGDFTVFLRVTKLIGQAQFALEDSVDAFTNNIVRWTVNVKGDISTDPSDPFNTTQGFLTFHVKSNEIPSIRNGSAGDVWRIALVEITGTSKTTDYQAWVEY